MIRKVICFIAMAIACAMLCAACNDISPAEIPSESASGYNSLPPTESPSESASGCNSLPSAESPSNSASAESSPVIQFAPLTEEELEHLRTVRAAVYDHTVISDTADGYGTIQHLEATIEKRKTDPTCLVLLENFRYEVSCDPTRDEYHSPRVAELLEQGMFINEVRELLGRPHGTTFAFLNVRMGKLTNTYTAYTLDDGRVLFLRFIQASVKDYSREELERRVPGFNERDWEVRAIASPDMSIGWFKLQEVKILDLKEFQNTAVGYVYTPEEELPDEYKNAGGINYGKKFESD